MSHAQTSPARVAFPRTTETGAVPEQISPGSFAVNWIDRKLYIGGSDGQPVLLSQWLADWSPALSYRAGDYAVRGGSIWRAQRDLTAGTPFSAADWELLTSSSRATFSEPYATSILSGGAVTKSGTNGIAVTAGSGVIVDRQIPNNIEITEISWGAFTAIVSDAGEAWSIVGIDASSAIVEVGLSAFSESWRRNHVVLAFVLWDSVNGEIVEIVDASLPAAGTAEALRDAFYAEGGAYRASGLRVRPDAGMTLALSAGTIFDLGALWRTSPNTPHLVSIAGQVPMAFRYTMRNQALGTTTAVNVAQYDSGANLMPVPAGSATIQYLSIAPDGSLYMQYGQRAYSSTNEALNELIADRDNLVVFTAGGPLIVLAAIIASATATSADEFTIVLSSGRGDAFIGAGTASGDTSQFLLLDGSRPMTGILNMNNYELGNALIDGGSML